MTAANYTNYIGKYADGLNPVIYDTDGSIIDALSGVVSITGPVGGPATDIPM